MSDHVRDRAGVCLSCLVLALPAIACGGEEGSAPNQNEPRELREPTALVDMNPDPTVVEVSLVATRSSVAYLPGKPAAVWAYRDGARPESVGTVPGPMLRARRGDEVIVHFRNELTEPTTIHWHGLRLPADADGSTSTQRPVGPGGTFDYRFHARDAGSFWYHPHVSADVQIERGLYGPLIVEGGTLPEVATDRYLVLDDVKLQADGSLSTATDDLDRMLGRQGNVLLVNGQRVPFLSVAPGARERWRFVNAANGRYFNLVVPGLRLLVIGTDGGLLPEPFETERLLIAPGERYEVLITFPRTAGTFELQTVHYDRGHDIPDPGPKMLLSIRTGGTSVSPAPLPTSWRDLLVLASSPPKATRTFTLSESEGPGGPMFFINKERWPINTPVVVKQGDTDIWELRNETEMDHPFHLHGMFFEVQSDSSGRVHPRAWKDTVNVPGKATLRFAVAYEPLGNWMFHCHILEHAELGMMGDLQVTADGQPGTPPGHDHGASSP